MHDNEIIEGIIAEFKGLAKHPRPSHHEKAVSDYIVSRLRELGVTDVVQDDVYNIVANVPASKGCESWPITVLQGHMDMVCVAKPGVDFDPLTSEIKLVREGNILRADGTSLGADDGIAVALSLYLIQQDIQHGPLRLIFTTDEETGMTGAMNLDPKHVQDVKYIINCDSEDIGMLGVGSAGSVHTHFNRAIHWQAPKGKQAFTIEAKDFVGGHSGETINRGKSNAIKALSLALRRIAQAGVAYTLASIEGGVAANAIPSQASAVIVTADEQAESSIKQAVQEEQAQIAEVYGSVETKAQFVVTAADVPAKAFSEDDTKAVVNLLNILHCGVFAMNQMLPKLPDLSANIGTIRTEEDVVAIQYFPRASSDGRLREFALTLPVFAELTGCTIDLATPEPAWAENPKSKLVPLFADVYREEAGRDPRIEAMHGGLETGYLFSMNQNLDIISVGPTTHDIHSADESVELDTVALLTRIVAKALGKLDK